MTAIIIVAGTKSDFRFTILQKVYYYDEREMSRFIGILGKRHNHWQYCQTYNVLDLLLVGVIIIIESCVTVDFTNVIMGRQTPLVIPFSYVRVHYYTIFATISVIVWLSTPPVAIKSARPINPLPAWTVREIPL